MLKRPWNGPGAPARNAATPIAPPTAIAAKAPARRRPAPQQSAQQRHQHAAHVGIVEDDDGVENPARAQRGPDAEHQRDDDREPDAVVRVRQVVELSGGMEHLVVEIAGETAGQRNQQGVGGRHRRREQSRNHDPADHREQRVPMTWVSTGAIGRRRERPGARRRR